MASDNVIGRLVETADSRRARLAIAGLVILLIMLAAPTRAFAQPLVVYDGPFVMTIPGPCVSTDVITLTGRMVMTFYGPLIRQPDGSGGMHTTFRTVVKAQGANNDPINPKKYVMNDEEVTDFNAPSGGTIDQTQVINQGVIRQAETTGDNILIGSGDDFMAKTTIHFTVNANGIPTATIIDIRSQCM